MMRSISVFFGICICLFATITANSQVQQMEKDPDALFRSGDFKRAGLYYTYREYLSHTASEIALYRLRQAECLKNQSDPGSAAKILDRTNLFGVTDSLKIKILYESMLMHYLAGEPASGVSRYRQAHALLDSSSLHQAIQLVLTLCYLDLQDWENAESYGRSYVSARPQGRRHSSVPTGVWHAFFEPDALPHIRDPKKAKIWSMIIPGAGQIYAGYPGQGLINTAIHLTLIGGAAFGFYQGYYFTAWLAGLGLLQKFYYGSVRRAEELCRIKNRQELDTYLLTVKKFLLSEQ